MLAANNFEQDSTTLKQGSNKGKLLLLCIFVVIIFFLFITYLLPTNTKSKKNLQSIKTANQESTSSVSTTTYLETSDAVEKIGNETIYKEELNSEYAAYPTSQSKAITKQLLAKIARDSIILQAGNAEKIIKLDSSVFNSPNVEYKKRIQLVNTVEKTISAKTNTISGSFIAIWFDNTSPGPAGYTKGKQIAFAAISPLYNQVKNKKITMDQAAQAIKNNAQLAQADPQYKANAISQFSAGPSDKITFNPTFDAMIRSLTPGHITQLYLGKDTDASGKTLDAVYMFAQVIKKSTTGQNENFDQWYNQQKQQYEITIY